MEKARAYLRLQFIRFTACFPVMFLVTVFLFSSLSVLAWILFGRVSSEDVRQKVHVGVVGDATDSYLGMGISIVENLDSTALMVEFENLDEKEAEKKLEQGKLSAYLQIPDDFLDSVLRGENRQITYVTTNGNPGLTDFLVDELADVISRLLTQTQTGIYGMQQYAVETGQTERMGRMIEDMNRQYIRLVFGREDISSVKELGVTEGLSLTDSFLCGLIVLVLLFGGVGGAPLLVKQDMSLYKVLFSRGLGAASQVFCEYLVWYFSVAVWGIPACLVLRMFLDMDLSANLFLVIAMICAMQFFFYELVSGILNGVFLQFISAVVMGYLSGCFYPAGFFPESVQKIGKWLPSGAALHFLAENTRRASTNGMALVAGYLICFLALSVSLRRYRLARS